MEDQVVEQVGEWPARLIRGEEQDRPLTVWGGSNEVGRQGEQCST